MNKDNKRKFDMSSIESVSEKPLLNKNSIFVRRVLPLITIHGIMYITDKIIYFQSFHSVSAKPVKKIQIDSITTVFLRRFELQYVNYNLL